MCVHFAQLLLLKTIMRDTFNLHLATFSISFSALLAIFLFLFGTNLTGMTVGLLFVFSLILSPFVKALIETLI